MPDEVTTTAPSREQMLEEIIRQLWSWVVELDHGREDEPFTDDITEYLIPTADMDVVECAAFLDVALSVCPAPVVDVVGEAV